MATTVRPPARHVAGRRARRRWLLAVVAAGVALLVLASLAVLRWEHGAAPQVFAPSFAGPDQLVTNEYAHRHPDRPGVHRSDDWEVTSGSLYRRGGVGWTGVPDAATPDAESATGTGSSVFRMTTRRHDFENVRVSLRLRTLGLTDRGREAPAGTDGVHLFLRWQDETELYVVSLNRRDDRMVIKKKLSGGEVNGGTYVTLGQVDYRVPLGAWQSFEVTIATTPSGSVGIDVRQGDRLLLAATDGGANGRPITGAGAVGVRGDNCEFELGQLRVGPVE
ncbi:hypothetical protein [Micromonospora chersina]|uniref:3-keto-disaccharide hydrolase domain-containing protein n=1 Tax=Micromonospora chersina TaxID=47854 RepID=A0A1C6VPI8_9ACTN|nr:hypothetical protein [Micromonospora chersina]SCL68223.1 hypothetical protein GA0070603_4691 [Micromonospora chersina]